MSRQNSSDELHVEGGKGIVCFAFLMFSIYLFTMFIKYYVDIDIVSSGLKAVINIDWKDLER